MKEGMATVEDAICAVRAAVEAGIVGGSGAAQLRACAALAVRGDKHDQDAGMMRTTDCMMTELVEDKPAAGGMPAGRDR
jgi:chaperonin GroEL (HSP60 family)